MVVDDSITTRTLEKNILEAAGYQVKLATDGEEALAALVSDGLPHLIVSDVNMPRLLIAEDSPVARELLVAILQSAPGLQIVIISASLNKHERDMTFSALEAGALSVLEKPTMDDPPEVYEALVKQVKLISEVKVVRRWGVEEQRSRGA